MADTMAVFLLRSTIPRDKITERRNGFPLSVFFFSFLRVQDQSLPLDSFRVRNERDRYGAAVRLLDNL